MRVSQLAQSFQLNPLYQMVVLYVQTGDEAYFFAMPLPPLTFFGRHAVIAFGIPLKGLMA